MHSTQPTGDRGPARRDLQGETVTPHREAIVSAARDLIHVEGYERLTVERVIQAAGVSRATFYFYFRNKKHLFLDVANSVMDEMFEVAGRHYPEKDDFTRIVLANLSYLGIWRRDPRILCEFFALSLIDRECHQIYDGHRRRFEVRIAGRITRLVDRNRIPDCDPTILAASLSSMVEFMAVRYFGPYDDEVKAYTFPEFLAILCESWYRAIYARRTPVDFKYEDYLLGEIYGLPGK